MKEFSQEQKQTLRDRIIAAQEASGLSGNEFATKRLGFTNGSKFSHIRNNWDKPGMVGAESWEVIEKYLDASNRYKGVATANLRKVWESCERAYELKKAIPVIGDSGLGKTFALESYKRHIEAEQRFKVVYFDASMIRTNKQFIGGLMIALDCYKIGTISSQLIEMRAQVTKQNVLICIDEVSSLEGHNITIIKDIMTAFKDLCGVVFSGTPYFINNLNKGASRDRHLFSETRDRLFMLPEYLEKPTEREAEEIFTANGITDKSTLDIVMGRSKHKALITRSWLAKKTFRGISDCIDLIRVAEMGSKIDYNTLNL
ncbi:MAG: ATP-binding protein [Paludibacter sp.]